MHEGAVPKEPQFDHPMKEARCESGLLAFAASYYWKLCLRRAAP
jgi:hypothetical protein